jgi:hypothetical protein
MERTYEEATEALHTGRESRHPEAALLDASMSFGVIAGGGAKTEANSPAAGRVKDKEPTSRVASEVDNFRS